MYCFHAYHAVSVENNSYRVCCYAKRSGITVNDLSIYDFYTSDYMKNIRDQLEQNQWPDACEKCKKFEEQGLPSLRTSSFENEQSVELNLDLYYLDLQFSNKCNLGCRMCWSGQSSIIAEEQGVYLDYTWNKSIINDFEKIKKIENIYITGGETLLVKHNYKLLEKIVNLGLAKNINLILNTNCTIFVESFINLIKKFKKVYVNLSIDGIGKVQEYIRWPSKWEEVELNFKKWYELSKQSSNINLYINPTIQLLNAAYLDEFIDYFNQFDVDYNINILEGPDYFNLSNTPNEIWELINKQKLKNEKINQVIKQKRKNRKPVDLLDQAKNFLKKQDELRKINLEDYKPYFGFLRDAEI